MSFENPKILIGKTLSPGMAEGKIFVYREALSRLDEFYDIEESNVDDELKRLERAIERISKDLTLLVQRVEEEIDSELSMVFDAHIAFLKDNSLRNEIEKEISDELVSAGSAVKTVLRRWERRFRSLESEVARQKADDMRDLIRRLVYSLAGIRGHALKSLPAGSVLAATRLLPSDTIFLSRRTASAALVEGGGPASHAALFAREIGLPCVAGIKNLLDAIQSGAYALVDADSAQAIINPSTEQKASFKLKSQKRDIAHKTARERSHYPAVTKDGKTISVLANIGSYDDAQHAMDSGADGIGLYRIEQIYLGRNKPLNAEELYKEMQRTLTPAGSNPVCVRLLDVGADKPLPFLEPLSEVNPALGRRGVRFLLEYRDLLATQLEVFLELSSHFDLSILVPMVTIPSDIRDVKGMLIDAAKRFRIKVLPKQGAMIETPAAALSAGEIAQYADFISFGTNDLTQYVFAADRENAAVSSYFVDDHDVIFKLIKTARDDAPQTRLSVCGELAGHPDCISKIIQCGVEILSVAPPMIPMVKEAVRKSSAAMTNRL